MFLEKRLNKKHNTIHLRLRRTYRTLKGEKKTRTILSLGNIPAEDKEALKTFEELVDNLNSDIKLAEEESRKIKEKIALSLNDSLLNSLNLGSVFIEKMLDFFGFRQTFAYTQRCHPKLGYQIYKDFYYLVITGILEPDSIREDVINQETYFKDYGIKLWDAYRSLTFIYGLYDKISKKVVDVVMKCFADTSGLFYIDATNIYVFANADPETIEQDGEKMPGLRHFGHSKESRDTLPLIGITIVMTHNGFPLLMLIYPGNVHDSQLLIPAMKKLASFIDIDRLTLCGDSAYNSSTNNYYLAGSNKNNVYNNGYVFSKTIKTSDTNVLAWINEPSGWFTLGGKPIPEKDMKRVLILLSQPEELEKDEIPPELQGLLNSSRYKQRTIVRVDEVWNHDKTKKIPAETSLKQIVFFSPKLRKKKLATIGRRINKAQNIKENPGKTSNIVKESTSEFAELEMNDAEIKINDEKILANKKKAGYFMLETSEKDLSPRTVLHIYNDKKWIEWNFRILKSELHLNPIYVYSMKHIQAVLLVRFVSLVIIKCLQFLLGYSYSTETIIKSLKNFRCVPVTNNQFLITGRNEVIKDLEEIFGIHFSKHMDK